MSMNPYQFKKVLKAEINGGYIITSPYMPMYFID